MLVLSHSFPQSDNDADNVDKIQPNDVKHETKAADDAINNNNLHSTALIKGVIHKKPALKEVHVKMENHERVTAETYTMSTVSKISSKTIRASFDSRERDSYDDAIEDYKNRVSKASKLDLPKVDINKRRELFEKEQKEDVSNLSTSSAASKLGSEIVSIKDRISSLRSNLETSTTSSVPQKKVEMPTTTKLKDRLSSFHQMASPVDEPKRNPIDAQFKNVQVVKNELEKKQQTMENHNGNVQVKLSANDDNESLESTDREDSGIQTTDVSCSVSQADEQTDQQLDEFQLVIQEKITILSVSEKAAEVAAKKEPEMEAIDDESIVSFSEDDQTQSVMVLGLDGTNKLADKEGKAPNESLIGFIQCNLLNDHRQFDDVQLDNNYVYECIINRSEHQQNNGIEKSNSIDTALSLCSSSDGQSLMDDADEKIHR